MNLMPPISKVHDQPIHFTWIRRNLPHRLHGIRVEVDNRFQLPLARSPPPVAATPVSLFATMIVTQFRIQAEARASHPPDRPGIAHRPAAYGNLDAHLFQIDGTAFSTA